MDRRSAMKLAAAGAFGATHATATMAQQPSAASLGLERARRGLPPLKITGVKTILTHVGRADLVNVKVYTSEAGLYGVGCGTHAERPTVVAEIIDKYLKPFLIGRNADEIEKLWQEMWIAPYWRASVDASNAISAIDGALWDIMGKRCGVPVHDLLGGKVRDGLRMMGDVFAAEPAALEDQIRKKMADGYQHFRIYLGNPTAAGPKPSGTQRTGSGGAGLPPAMRGNDAAYINELCTAFEAIRTRIGWDIEIGHDVHERPSPQGAIVLAKAVEKYRPFFIEDLFAPEDADWYKIVRQQAGIGIAMGELFVNQNEWLPLVSARLIDYFRMHISAGGGLSIARKIAHTCEFFGVRTAWHGPANVSPVGHAVNMHLDLSVYNFGICEGGDFSQALQDLFPGCPEIRKGVRYPNSLPGLGIDIDEVVARRFPPGTEFGSNRAAFDQEGGPRRP